jgi:hypothetical protein
MNTEQFLWVMQTIAEGWNRDNAGLAASCFTEDAVYSGPPSTPHRGRKALYEYFGGARGRELPMQMTWHNLIFDPDLRIGVGEYTRSNPGSAVVNRGLKTLCSLASKDRREPAK